MNPKYKDFIFILFVLEIRKYIQIKIIKIKIQIMEEWVELIGLVLNIKIINHTNLIVSVVSQMNFHLNFYPNK